GLIVVNTRRDQAQKRLPGWRPMSESSPNEFKEKAVERVTIPPAIHITLAQSQCPARENPTSEISVVNLNVFRPGTVQVDIRWLQQLLKKSLGIHERRILIIFHRKEPPDFALADDLGACPDMSELFVRADFTAGENFFVAADVRRRMEHPLAPVCRDTAFTHARFPATPFTDSRRDAEASAWARHDS